MKSYLVFIFISFSLVYSFQTQAEMKNIIENYAVELRGSSGWKSKKDSCYYAIAAARRKAIRECQNERKGTVIKTDRPIESCNSCKQSKHFKEWWCTGRVTVQCMVQEEVADAGVINKARGVLQKKSIKYKQNRPRLGSPCTKNIYSSECRKFRRKNRKAGGPRG